MEASPVSEASLCKSASSEISAPYNKSAKVFGELVRGPISRYPPTYLINITLRNFRAAYICAIRTAFWVKILGITNLFAFTRLRAREKMKVGVCTIYFNNVPSRDSWPCDTDNKVENNVFLLLPGWLPR